jgi:hypothetical protein
MERARQALGLAVKPGQRSGVEAASHSAGNRRGVQAGSHIVCGLRRAHGLVEVDFSLGCKRLVERVGGLSVGRHGEHPQRPSGAFRQRSQVGGRLRCEGVSVVDEEEKLALAIA